MEEKEREQLKERLLKMVVNEPRLESMPPMTMAEVMVNSMSKPNLEPLLDFISQEQNRAREEGGESIIAQLSLSENMEKVERFFREAPIDYDDKCNLWFDFLSKLTTK
jgi:hypothetical protein